MIKTVFYISTPKSGLTLLEAENVFHETKVNNDKLGIFGVLVMYNQTFYQVIEGESKVIDDVYYKIKKDHRHHGIIEILNQDINTYSFKSFGYGYNICHDIDSPYSLHTFIESISIGDSKARSLFDNVIKSLLSDAC